MCSCVRYVRLRVCVKETVSTVFCLQSKHKKARKAKQNKPVSQRERRKKGKILKSLLKEKKKAYLFFFFKKYLYLNKKINK